MSTDPNKPNLLRGKRLAIMGALVALTIGLSGFFMALRQVETASAQSRSDWRQTKKEDSSAGIQLYPEAPRYSDLKGGTFHPNKEWKPNLVSLAPLQADAQYTPAVLNTAELTKLRSTRDARRQYDGAPPVAPHPVDQRNPAACLECHGKPTMVGAISVPQISHPIYANCIQCHVSALGPASGWVAQNIGLSEGNSFNGKDQPGAGQRAYMGAPPVVPHTTRMRENCMSCHGPGGTAAMRTSHPNRQSCTQCHAPNADLDQRFAAGLPPPLPVSEWKTKLQKN